jgi:predicted RNase H-like nuclease (RuvC/YqgF family)
LLLLIEKIQNWWLNKEKLRYEVEKTKLEVKKLKLEIENLNIELERKISERRASSILNSLIHRLESNPIKLEDIEVDIEGTTDIE